MKRNTFFKIMLLFAILIITFLIIRSTYSKYVSHQSNNSKINIANLNIKLNDIDIRENKDFSENINLIFDENPYVEPGTLAPLSSGNFNINLDSTGTAIPYIYLLKLDKNSNFDITLTDYIVNKTEEITITKIYFTLTLDFSYYENFDKLEKATIDIDIPTANLTNYKISNSTNARINTEKNTILFDVEKISESPYTFDFELEYSAILEFPSRKLFSRININNIPFEYRNNDIPDLKIYNYIYDSSELHEPVKANGNITNTETNTVAEPISEESAIILDLPYLIDTVYPNFSEGGLTRVYRDFVFNFKWDDSSNNITDNYNDVKVSKGISNNISNTIVNSVDGTQVEKNTVNYTLPIKFKIMQITSETNHTIENKSAENTSVTE